MRAYLLSIVVAIFCVTFPGSVFTKDAVKTSEKDASGTIQFEKVTYGLPVGFPSAEEILRELPEASRRKTGSIKCDLLFYRVEPARHFPGLGNGRMATAHFKCTVSTDSGDEFVYIAHDRLLPEK